VTLAYAYAARYDDQTQDQQHLSDAAQNSLSTAKRPNRTDPVLDSLVFNAMGRMPGRPPDRPSFRASRGRA
jgi:hypothetical protein